MPDQRQSSVVPAPIRRRQAIEVFGNRFGRLYNDVVVFPSGARGSYLRWQWNQQGVVVVPVGPAGLALVPTYRYPVGASSLEFPRGGCEPGEDPQAAAARELEEESGLKALSVRNLGQIHTDTGLIETSAHVCLAVVQPSGDAQARPEATESVAPLSGCRSTWYWNGSSRDRPLVRSPWPRSPWPRSPWRWPNWADMPRPCPFCSPAHRGG